MGSGDRAVDNFGNTGCVLLLLCFLWGFTCLTGHQKDGQKQTVSYKTEAVDKEIDELGLCEGDKEVLRQVVEELGCYEKEPEKQLTATVRYLFFKIKLYPMKLKQKPEKEEKKKEPSPQKANQKESKKEETSFDIKAMLPAIWECAKKPLTMILRSLCKDSETLCIGFKGRYSTVGAGCSKTCHGSLYRAWRCTKPNSGKKSRHSDKTGIFQGGTI